MQRKSIHFGSFDAAVGFSHDRILTVLNKIGDEAEGLKLTLQVVLQLAGISANPNCCSTEHSIHRQFRILDGAFSSGPW